MQITVQNQASHVLNNDHKKIMVVDKVNSMRRKLKCK